MIVSGTNAIVAIFMAVLDTSKIAPKCDIEYVSQILPF